MKNWDCEEYTFDGPRSDADDFPRENFLYVYNEGELTTTLRLCNSEPLLGTNGSRPQRYLLRL